MAENITTLQDALEKVSHPDIDAIVKGWNKAANLNLGPVTADEWHAGRKLAQQNTLLRTAYCLFKEEFLTSGTHSFTVTPDDKNQKPITLSSAEDVVDLLYTRNLMDKFDLTLNGYGDKPKPLNDISTLWNDVLKPQAEAKTPRSDYNWNLAQYELLDSLNNETLSMARRVKLFDSIKSAEKNFDNGWDWMRSDEGMPRFLAEANRLINDPSEKRDEGLFLQELAALSGHRMHPMAHTRTRVEGELDKQGQIIRDPSGATPVSSLTTEEVLENGGAFGLTNHLPVAALHVKEANIRAVEREGVDDPVNGVGQLSPEKYRARFEKQNPEIYKNWEKWVADQGQNVADYVPLPMHSLNVPYVQEHMPFTRQTVDGKPSLMIPPPERKDLAIAAMTTTSTRTLMPIESADADHLKLPIPVQVTSVRRHLAPARVFSAPVVTNLIEKIVGVDYADARPIEGEDKHLGKYMKVIPEPVGIYWDDKGQDQRYSDAYFLGCITRENPSHLVAKDQVLLELNNVFERSPFSGKPLVVDMLKAHGNDSPEKSLEWFKDYADTVVQGQVGILARYGIGLEAHQQNTFSLFNKKTGTLDKTVNRDFADGAFMAEPMLELRGKNIRDDIHPVKKYLSDDVETPTKQLYHGMVASHLFPLARVLSVECGMDADKAVAAVRQSIQTTFTAAREDFGKTHKQQSPEKIQFDQLTGRMEKWLNQAVVKEKALLTMRLDQTFEAPPLYRDNLLKSRAAGQQAGASR